MADIQSSQPHFMNEETEKQIHTYILALLYLQRLSLGYL